MNKILYQIAFLETYIMTGYSKTQIFKYAIMAFGLWEATGTRNLKLIMWIGISYVAFCWLLGWFVYKIKYVNALMEIGNQYNPLAKQLRGKFRMAKDIKSIKS